MFSSIGKTPESGVEARERPARSTSAAWAQALKHQKWQGVCRRDDRVDQGPLNFLSLLPAPNPPSTRPSGAILVYDCHQDEPERKKSYQIKEGLVFL